MNKPTRTVEVPPFRHTPGPWFVKDTGTPLGREIVDAAGGAIGYRTNGSDEEALANAELIARAPAMWDALQMIRKKLTNSRRAPNLLESIEASVRDGLEERAV